MRRMLSLGCLSILSIAVLGTAWFLASQIPAASRQLAPDNTPLIVSLIRPVDGDAYPAGSELNVRGEAIAVEPLQIIELWADGILVRSEPPGKLEQQYAVKSFSWEMPAMGSHTLVARALDTKGRTTYSNIVHVASIAAKGSRVLYTAKQGDTFDSIGKQYGVPANKIQIVGANGGTSNQPLTPGVQVFVDLPAPPAPPSDSNQPAPPPPANTDAPSSDSTSGTAVWFDQNIVAKFNPPPTPLCTSAVLFHRWMSTATVYFRYFGK